jgi:hypothetical protein
MNKLILLGFVFALLLAGCAQQVVKNETKNETPPRNGTPPIQPPPPPPPIKNETNVTKNETVDEDMFSEDLDDALDDLDAVTDPSDLEQTSEKTFCDSDNDCWCRIFDGAKFLPGKSEWSCNMQTGRCQKCLYR